MIADEAFAEVKALVIARTGHHYYIDKDAQLAERVAHRMAATGDATIAAYRDRLRDPADAEWPHLESAVTINETFFFRFAEQFSALRTTILPAMIERNRDERRLRIWSVGCSTGAEAHSVAILLADLLGDGIADWRIVLTGTDIDEAALSAARSADYSAWALRTMGEAERERLFDRSGDRYRLKDRYRGIARFERHNLLTMIDAAAPLGYGDYDLILCRNVLIYFAQDDATAIVGALARRLATDGILLLGHAEPNPGFDAVADTAQVAGILTYRPLRSQPRPVAPPVELAPPLPALLPRRRPPRGAPARTRTAPPGSPPARRGGPLFRRARRAGIGGQGPRRTCLSRRALSGSLLRHGALSVRPLPAGAGPRSRRAAQPDQRAARRQRARPGDRTRRRRRHDRRGDDRRHPPRDRHPR
ncbi:CheR family methyltransferase [Sphingomonas hankookensis]|uniref:CheR family methyltransferase n=1 Tax=Sphingomonas hankookensis TaxID=563996 RepID=UPI003F78DD78